VWKEVFDAFRKSLLVHLQHTLENIWRHEGLVRSQATLVQCEGLQTLRNEAVAAFKANREATEERRRKAVLEWLSAAEYDADQEKNNKIREEYPETGRWLLGNDLFKSWFQPDVCTAPILWISGIPGAGKGILLE
jgi:hypothetical protein